MSYDDDIEAGTPDDIAQVVADVARGREAMAQWAPSSPRPAFRERLGRDFAAGTIVSALSDAVERPTESGPRLVPRRSWRQVALRFGVPAAAAAAIAAVMALNQGQPWRVVSAAGEGVAVVDGRPVPMNHMMGGATIFKPGARVRVPTGCMLKIASGDVLHMEFTAGADATIPAPPSRWLGRRVSSEIQAGEARIATGPAFLGAQLTMSTPSAHIEVTGTALAVILDGDGTCVCVHEGRVKVGRDTEDMVEVESGRRRFVFNDLRLPETGDIRESEIPELERMRNEVRGVTGSAK